MVEAGNLAQQPPPLDVPAPAPAAVRPISGLKPPSPLITESRNLQENWKLFLQKWQNYSTLTALNSHTMEYQVALLLHTLGDDALRVYNGFDFETPDNQRTVQEIIDAFEAFAVGEVNETYERYIFNKRCQEEGETFELFVAALRKLVKTCNYCNNCVNSIIRDRIVLGIRDPATQQELLKVRRLTLENTIDICRAASNATVHHKVLHGEAVNKVEYKRRNKPRKPESSRTTHNDTRRSGQPDKTCKFCGRVHPMVKSKCKAYGKTCDNCGEKNHFAVKCPKSSRRVHQLQEQNTETQEYESSGDEWVDSVAASPRKDVKCRMVMKDGTEVVFQVDTGSSVNVLPARYHPEKLQLQPVIKTLFSWNNGKITALGTYRHSMRNPKNGKKYSIEFVIVKENFTPILGLRTSEALGFVTVNDTFERVSSLRLEDYDDVFEPSLGSLPGVLTLQVNPDVKPVVMPDRRVPISVRPKLKEELDRLVSQGVIQPVDVPTPWVSQLVITTKKSGALRVCIDPKELNKALLRESFTLPILEDTLHLLSSSTVFTKADLASGYWHVILDEASSLLTTFQTCFGRYRWLRLPFGTSVSSEIFQKKLLHALEGLEGVVCVADDIIIHGKDMAQHDENLQAFLLRCKEIGIRLNRAKFDLRTNEITFLGHRISSRGLEADPEKVKAISQMVPPTNVKELRRFIGMVNYMAKFLPNLYLKPLTNLTKSDVPWNWSSAENDAFEKIKVQITTAPVLAFYDPAKELTLENDASEYGLGSALRQEGRPIAYASRTLTETECRYAQIEKEMLAVTFGLQKFHHYTFGRTVHVVTDHKPLVAIASKPLSNAPKRLQNMLLRAQLYNVQLRYEPGTSIPVADALSRAPLNNPGSVEESDTINNLTYCPVKERQCDEIRQASSDEEMIKLKETIMTGWPTHKDQVPVEIRAFFPYRDELTVQDGLVIRGQRLVIPKSLRRKMTTKCHAGHLGINASLRRARDTIFWPGMSTEVRDFVETCGICSSMPVKLSPEPVISREIPERPWQRVGSDIMTFESKNYLITTDPHSSFFEIDLLQDLHAETVIHKLKKNFARHGIPEEVITDSGTQFTSDCFKRFAVKWGFHHVTSSPGNHRANGAAEAAVKTVKRLFKRCKAAGEDPFLGILNQRNTPTEGTDTSPVQKMFGRRTRTTIPTISGTLDTATGKETKTKKEDHTAPKLTKINETLKELPPLTPGQSVRMQPIDGTKKEWKEGKVTRRLSNRTYEIQADGKKFRRNRSFVRPVKQARHHIPEQDSIPLPITSQANTTVSDRNEHKVVPTSTPRSSQPLSPKIKPPTSTPRSSQPSSPKVQPPTPAPRTANPPVAAPRPSKQATSVTPSIAPPKPEGNTSSPGTVTTRSGRVSRPPNRLDI